MLAAFALVLAMAAVPPDGAAVYGNHCISCHGAHGFGSQDGPSLRGVGAAALDFYLTTGRMPAAVPWLEVRHRDERTGQQLAPGEIAALETYLAPVVAGGPALPQVVANGDRRHGEKLFQLNCEQCHGLKGNGGDLGGLDWVPALNQASIMQVAEAIRAGPGQMPQFGDHQLDQTDLNDVASYVMQLMTTQQPADVPPFRSTGPVPEGAVGYLALLALIAFVFTFWRADASPREREESVRRSAPEEPS